MIKVQLKDVVNSIDIFREWANKELKSRTAFKLARLFKALDNEFTMFNETRTKIVDKYTEKDENGNPVITETNEYKLKEDQIGAFQEEMTNLLDTEISLDVDPIQIEDIESIENTPAQMMVMEPFIEG